VNERFKMEDKEHKELEKKIEKTNERISVCVGTGIAAMGAVMAGASALLFIAMCGIGGGAGIVVHSTRKWLKNRKRRKQI